MTLKGTKMCDSEINNEFGLPQASAMLYSRKLMEPSSELDFLGEYSL
jgi:hypothetical protein